MAERTDLDVDAPWRVADVLFEAAADYRESGSEVAAAWGEEAPGAVWDDIADVLDEAGEKIRRLVLDAGLEP